MVYTENERFVTIFAQFEKLIRSCGFQNTINNLMLKPTFEGIYMLLWHNIQWTAE